MIKWIKMICVALFLPKSDKHGPLFPFATRNSLLCSAAIKTADAKLVCSLRLVSDGGVVQALVTREQVEAHQGTAGTLSLDLDTKSCMPRQ